MKIKTGGISFAFLPRNAAQASASCEARAERAGALATRPRAERALRTQVAPKVKVTRVTSGGTGTHENVPYVGPQTRKVGWIWALAER